MNKRITIIALLLITTGFIGMSVTAKKTLLEPERIIDVQVFPSDEVEAVYIESGIASLNIEPAETDEVQVVWEGKERLSGKQDITMELQGDELHINLDRSKLFGLFRIDFIFQFNKLREHLDIYLPEKLYKSIYVNSNLGATKITSLHAESIEVKSDVANITLDDIVAAQLNITTSIGDVTLKEVNAKMKVVSDIGDITVVATEINANMILESNIGDVTVKVPHAFENISFFGSSDLGSVNIFGSKSSHMSDNPDHTVSIETDIGDIDVVVQP